MSRTQRYQSVSAFAERGDFNEQLYLAVRKSPWWMMSLALHALVFAIAGLMPTATPPAAPPPQAQVAVSAPAETPPEVEKKDADEDVDTIVPSDLTFPEPETTVQAPEAPENTDDVNLKFNELFGEAKLADGGPFEGIVGNVSVLGIGGGAGPFGGRGRGSDHDGRRHGSGPTKKTEDSIDDALRWLAAHQSPSGAWETAGFDQWCNRRPADPASRPDGLGKPMYDPGVTGLALLAFLGAGRAPRGSDPMSGVVRDGLRWLKSVQDPEGCFGPRTTQHFIYNHAIAALAMVEAYAMTQSPIWKSSAQRGLDFIALARNPYFAWRYGIKPGDNDTSVTGWMMMALKSAKLVDDDAVAHGDPAPLQIDLEAFDGIRSWLDKVTDADYGRVGYIQQGSGPARPQELVDRFPTDKSESMTAVGVLARIFIGEDPRKSAVIAKGVKLMSNLLPTWNPSDGSIDMYYWYYATLAMYQVGGDSWAAWNKAMVPSMVDHQHKDGEYCNLKGSWDPIDPWGADGGRVYSTALLAMCLEVYYRYDRVVGTR